MAMSRTGDDGLPT